MRYETDILIIGGGLAGLTSSIHLSRAGFSVTVIEKNPYPQHKVCGEYISNEVLSYLQHLDADPLSLNPALITDLEFSTLSGKSIQTHLPLGGFGISRYTLDHFMHQHAIKSGVTIYTATVNDVHFENDSFTVFTTQNNFKATLVLGAYGKRAMLDQQLNRDFMSHKSPWLAVKAHYTGNFPQHLVALHHFKGGYCGVSNIEDNLINICYLTDYGTFKKHKNITAHRENVLYQNKKLRSIFESSVMTFEQPLSISQISFAGKEPVKNHILMIGDTAGLIHPLCGNGMGMAIHSAKICAELVVQYFEKTLTRKNKNQLRQQLENSYISLWHKNFNKRIFTGRILAGILRKEYLAEKLFSGLVKFPSLLPAIIKQTHGKPLI